MNPKFKLPDRKQLSDSILDHTVNKIEQSHQTKLDQIHEQGGITLVFDGWKNVLKQELLGSMLILPSEEPIVWKVLDISGERDRAVDILPHIEKMMIDLCNDNIKLAAIISDSAAAYASARYVIIFQFIKLNYLIKFLFIINRRQLRVKHPAIVFLPCFAHQCNLAVGEIFKEAENLAEASIDTVKLFLYFTHPNHAYFIGKLCTIQMELYHKYYAILKPEDT